MTIWPLYVILGGLVGLLVCTVLLVVITAWKYLDKPAKRVRR